MIWWVLLGLVALGMIGEWFVTVWPDRKREAAFWESLRDEQE